MKENYREHMEIDLNQNSVAGKVFILESTALLEDKEWGSHCPLQASTQLLKGFPYVPNRKHLGPEGRSPSPYPSAGSNISSAGSQTPLV